ncbi:DNA polymerase IV [Bacillus carboniphilus]|uniref:DNA polymerase IV n=1 Tax=Bacillus carboniphilus TaxID=86663 RepID=A0ABY9JWV5_9BACI|nr:DNA polymerase IV [Bacillus carboniphilus]WLR43855.1 DNA polymerase IV [Bacillus carboniphilus]
MERANGKVIFHVDMNSFYASVEMAHNCDLRGKPLAVAGNPKERKGIVVTCSYEARKHGVRAAMPLWQARKLCPNMIVVKPNFDLYRQASSEIFQVLKTYTQTVEPVSIDEGYLDVSQVPEHPLTIAQNIQDQLYNELLLPCSIGIAPNKFLAKMASNMKKPLGITVLRKRQLKERLWPLPIEEMHGVGKKSTEKLNQIEVYTIDDLVKANKDSLRQFLGINGIRLQERAMGIDNREVDPSAIYDIKSVGNSTTISNDTVDMGLIEQTFRKLAHSVSSRLTKKELMMEKISITIRYADRKTITRSYSLENPLAGKEEIFAQSMRLFHQHWNEKPIRLLGITGQELVDESAAMKQLDLFTFEKDVKDEPIINVMNELQTKYGKSIIKKGLKIKEEEQGETSFNKDFLRD